MTAAGALLVGNVCAKQIFPSSVSAVKLSQFLDLPVDLGVFAKELEQNNNSEIKIKNFYTYGINSKSQFRIKNIKQLKEFSEYDLVIKLPGKKNIAINRIKIPLLGIHNILNSTAAVAVALTIGISQNIIKNGLKEFKGV